MSLAHNAVPTPRTPSDDERVREVVRAGLEDFLAERERTDVPAGLDAGLVAELSALALADGKRIRPTFAWWGWRAAGGADLDSAPAPVLRALVALELLQCCALVHDDVMDRSATRRGRPTTHTTYADRHRTRWWCGDAERFGDSVAIVVGDLALSWADDALVTSGLGAAGLTALWEPWRAMRTEMMAGQYRDLLASARREESVPETMTVARLKTAAYTVERPLHLGAALAGATPELVDALRAFGRDIGVAFQLRDDLLGVFGDEHVTGKPVGDDLREGKRTPLVAIAFELAAEAGREDSAALLRSALDGAEITPALVEEVRATLRDLGAVQAVEERITELTGRALSALRDVDMSGDARSHLLRLATKATTRRR
ncbi:polyprenyl synthetase family protein [Umezawaea beigongshangensis]|uniref:polyprenyl synthetase family protein n=1 Tax=Umezawaea beigongshangensis TaxID=2780383 RepID=UPI0018F22D14|nr:polyprenyl synthetase family protein [Umezawaea beigongshangensis]